MIKRGTPVIWHRPSFDTEVVKKYKSGVVMRDSDGKPIMHTVHHAAEDFEGQCFGILRRPGRDETALVRLKDNHQMSEISLSKLEER